MLPVSPWLFRMNPAQDSGIRLFCLPYAGASASAYRRWAHFPSVGLDLWSIQLPGRANRVSEPPENCLRSAADRIASAIAQHSGSTFALFGHSMGAMLAFEVCRILQRRSVYPGILFVSGSRAPHHDRVSAPLHLLSDGALMEELSLLNGTPPEVLANPELARLVLPIVRADLKMIESYVYESSPPLDVDIVGFAGERDRLAPTERMQGWRRQTRGSFELHTFQGDHFFINSHRKELLAMLAQFLDRLTKPQSNKIKQPRVPQEVPHPEECS